MIRCGSKIEVSELLYCSGGGATNSAVSFTKLGFDTRCICKIGTDDAGKFITQELKNAGVGTENIIVDQGKQSGTAFIISNARGEQTVFVHRGVNNSLESSEVPEDIACDQLYVTSLNGISAKLLPDIVMRAKEKGINVAINPGSNQMGQSPNLLKSSLQYVDTFILNKCEAESFIRYINKNTHFNIQDFAKQILELGPKVVCVTDGANGVWVAPKDKRIPISFINLTLSI